MSAKLARFSHSLLFIFFVLRIQNADGTEYSETVLMDPEMYSYKKNSPLGPNKWKADACISGERQSPINLDDVDSVPAEFPDLEWHGHWDQREEGFILRNTGHSAEIDYLGDTPFLSGGPLTSEYALAQVHFHWGKTATEGSEHSLDDHHYGMEAHFVHYKSEYGSVTNASGHLDGLAVVGIFFKASRGNNIEFNPIVEQLEEIIEEGESIKIPGDSMEWLEAYSDMQRYFTYLGSLTTPPCSEIVTWIVMREPATIGQRQIEEFKNLKGHEGEILDNVRPVQELKGRPVFHSNKSFAPKISFSPLLISLAITALVAHRRVVSYLF